eukprot:3728655-Pleurochrysis_carterae.AAC.4
MPQSSHSTTVGRIHATWLWHTSRLAARKHAPHRHAGAMAALEPAPWLDGWAALSLRSAQRQCGGDCDRARRSCGSERASRSPSSRHAPLCRNNCQRRELARLALAPLAARRRRAAAAKERGPSAAAHAADRSARQGRAARALLDALVAALRHPAAARGREG